MKDALARQAEQQAEYLREEFEYQLKQQERLFKDQASAGQI